MRIAFQVNTAAMDGWNLQEFRTAQAFEEGTKRVRPDIRVIYEQYVTDPVVYDMVGIFGVKNASLIKLCQEKKIPFLYFDKSYNRDRRWWKMSICGHHPTQLLTKLSYPEDRRKVQRWEYLPWRKPTEKGHILLAGSSGKYHRLYDLPHPTEYWTGIVQALREVTSRRILYRPKKSWKEATPIAGTEFSKASNIEQDLHGAHCMITHGSNSCFEALVEGIPSIVLGGGVTAPISSLSINQSTIDSPYEASNAERDMILNNLAYFQWHMRDLKSGIFWKVIDDCLRIQETV